MNWRALGKRDRGPTSATIVAADTWATPRNACRAAITARIAGDAGGWPRRARARAAQSRGRVLDLVDIVESGRFLRGGIGMRTVPPTAMAIRPRLQGRRRPPAMAEEELPQPMPRAELIALRGFARPHQIPQGFMRGVRHPHRGQVVRPIAPHQFQRVPAIGLHPVARFHRSKLGATTSHPTPSGASCQYRTIARRPRLVTHAQSISGPELHHQLPERLRTIRNTPRMAHRLPVPRPRPQSFPHGHPIQRIVRVRMTGSFHMGLCVVQSPTRSVIPERRIGAGRSVLTIRPGPTKVTCSGLRRSGPRIPALPTARFQTLAVVALAVGSRSPPRNRPVRSRRRQHTCVARDEPDQLPHLALSLRRRRPAREWPNEVDVKWPDGRQFEIVPEGGSVSRANRP